jgi:hypothetical protein
MSIGTTHDICGELTAKGYSVVRRDEIVLTHDMETAWETLRAAYPDLPPDEFLPGGLKYRYRRFGRFYFLPMTGELLPLPHVDYFQSKDINKVTGGIVRKFAPLLPEMFENAFLKELIRFDFHQFPLSEEMKRGAWNVDVHLMRVVAERDLPGQPTPEGIHRDGAEFVTVHLAELENVTGGTVGVYDLHEHPLVNFTLETLLDSYFLHDTHVLHDAQPIRAIDTTTRGVRSILTFDYKHQPALEKP